MKKYLTHIVWFVVAIAAFFGGTYYSKATVPVSGNRGNFAFSSSTRAGFTGRGGAGVNGGGFATGQILSMDSQSFTVQLPNGNSEIVFYSSSTQVSKPSPASVNDLVPGTNVVVGGMQNPDGSVSAQTVQIRESMPVGR